MAKRVTAMSPKVVAHTVNARYYYKAYGMTPHNTPFQTAGPIEANNAVAAMRLVEKMTGAWNAKVVQSISLYSVDEYGQVSEDPELVRTGAMGKNFPVTPAAQQPLVPWNDKAQPSHNVRKQTALDTYKEADWLEEVEIDKTFATVKYNEETTT